MRPKAKHPTCRVPEGPDPTRTGSWAGAVGPGRARGGRAPWPAWLAPALLALAWAVGPAPSVALGEESNGPVLAIPGLLYGARPVHDNLVSRLLPDGAAPAALEEPAPDANDAADAATPAGPAAPADDPSDDADGAPDEDAPTAPDAPEKPRRELTQGMAALRDQVRRTLAAHRSQPLSTADNTVTDVLYACRAFGCKTEVFEAVTLRTKLNGITCLTWNYPCAGFTPLTLSDGHITGRIGYGYQEHPGELIAVLALARVPASYPARVGEHVRTVADLVEYEKLACREGTDKSLSMIGLMYYAGREGPWRNRSGELWSMERILREELAKPVVGAPWGGTQRLMGLAYVVQRRAKRNQPMEGEYLRARDYLARFHDHALSLQNENGTWSPHYLAAKGTSGDAGAVLASTGRILEWLAFSLPEERLDEPGVVRAVHWVNQALSSGRYAPRNTKALRTEEIGAVMHALAGLRYYDERYFRPTDPTPID